MAHKIDFRDLGIFLPNGFHPLEFRTLAEDAYQWMIQGGDHPNRRHLPYYENFLKTHGYRFSLLRSGIISSAPPDFWKPIEPHVEHLREGIDYTSRDLDFIEEIRPRLLDEFRHLPATDLLTAGVFLIAEKASV